MYQGLTWIIVQLARFAEPLDTGFSSRPSLKGMNHNVPV